MTPPDSLTDILARAVANATAPLCVAYSGGPDSTALLHALAHNQIARRRGLRALHVDHGLHPDSRAWASWCTRVCDELAVPLQVRAVTVERNGRGIEAAARDARYGALLDALDDDEWLLTAHHRNDQAETVLLKLLRGAGPEGLGGMRALRAFGNTRLWRPLLDTPRATLTQYLHTHHLHSLDDPANRSPELSRGHLRAHVLPALRQHWPHADRAIAHAANLNRQAADYIHQQARRQLRLLRSAPRQPLDAMSWLCLHPALRGPVLDDWLYEHGLPAPGLAQRRQIERQIRDAATDRVPLVRWPHAAVHIWRGQLHAHPPLPTLTSRWQCNWHGQRLILPGGGTLTLLPDPAPDDIDHAPPSLSVTLGESGVSLRPAGGRHHRKLRLLYQEAGIAPWLRPLCPLIHSADGELLAVADLWQTDTGQQLFHHLERQPRWRPYAQ